MFQVVLSCLEFQPCLNYVTVPKVVPQVYLNAKVVNTTQYIMLPGKVNSFLDNSLVAKVR